jgi:hypothetical protein
MSPRIALIDTESGGQRSERIISTFGHQDYVRETYTTTSQEELAALLYRTILPEDDPQHIDKLLMNIRPFGIFQRLDLDVVFGSSWHTLFDPSRIALYSCKADTMKFLRDKRAMPTHGIHLIHDHRQQNKQDDLGRFMS